MRELERKQKIRHRLYSTPALVGLALLTVVLGKSALDALTKAHQSAEDANALSAKVTALSNQEISLKKDISDLNTEAGLEAAIKEKFNVSAAGEHVAVIVDEDSNVEADSTNTKPWYKNLWDGILSSI